MFDFWSSIPLMALTGLVSAALLLVLSVADQRRTEAAPAPVPARVPAPRRAPLTHRAR